MFFLLLAHCFYVLIQELAATQKSDILFINSQPIWVAGFWQT